MELQNKIFLGAAMPDVDDGALVILQNKRILFLTMLAAYVDMIVKGVSPLSLPGAIADSLEYVKAFGGTEYVPQTYLSSVVLDGGTEQRSLPDNYIQRQFIYMMDDSYLVPDIMPEVDWHIEMDFQTTSLSTAGVRDYFGGRHDGSVSGAGIRLAHTAGRKVIMYGFDTNNAYTGSTYNMVDNTRYKYVYNNGSASLSTGGTVVDSTTFTPDDTTTSVVAINGYRYASGGFSSTTEGIYLYSFKAWNGQGELVANYVPAVQKGTVPVVGFYDTVSETFKTATAGTFAAGGEAVPTPDAPMDIVCNNGVVKYGQHGKNLLNPATNTNGYRLTDTGTTTPDADAFCTAHIPVVAGSTYTYSQNTGASIILRICEYDSTNALEKLNKYTSVGQQAVTITMSANTSYIIISADNRFVSNPPQLELGPTATAYEPYFFGLYTDGTQEVVTDAVGNTASAEMLLALSTYKDTQDVISGVVTRNIGIKVLDGSENWALGDSTFRILAFSPLQIGGFSSGLICSHLQAGIATENSGWFTSGGNVFQVKINGFAYDDAGLADFKQWLADQYNAGTPVILAYPVAAPTTESVSPQVLTTEPITQTAGSLSGLGITATESTATQPTPTRPLDIRCNNGVLKLSPNLIQGEWFLNKSRTSAEGRLYDLSGAVASDIFHVQSNTTYTVAYNGVAKTARWYEYDANKSYIVDSFVSDSGTITTSGDTKYISVSFTSAQLSDVVPQEKYKLCSVNKGNVALPFVPYGAIYTDGTVETVKVHGKNFFDKNNTDASNGYIANAYLNSSGSTVSNSGYNVSVYISVNGNTEYYYAINGSESSLVQHNAPRVAFYDSNKEYISSSDALNYGSAFTTPVNCSYLRLPIYKTALEYGVQLERGSTATTYEPYYNGGSLECPMLLSVGS